MLPEGADLGDVRDWQCRHLLRKIEEFNVDFSLPVLIGVSLGEGPTSPLYHLLAQGYAKIVPKSPEAPDVPSVDVLSMASCRVSWNPPDQGDGAMQRYRIDRKTGRATVLCLIMCEPPAVFEYGRFCVKFWRSRAKRGGGFHPVCLRCTNCHYRRRHWAVLGSEVPVSGGCHFLHRRHAVSAVCVGHYPRYYSGGGGAE